MDVALTQPIGHRIIRLAETDSTNRLVLNTPQYLLQHGLVVLAAHQRAGRGRVGRSWVSLPGKQLQFSVVLHPPLSREEAPLLSLLAGLAVGRSLQRDFLLTPRLKWPNDVYADGRKLCGILAELKPVESAYRVVLGIGLNCLGTPADFPAPLSEKLTTMSAVLGKPVDMETVFQAVLASLQREYLRLVRGSEGGSPQGRQLLLEEWQQLAHLAGAKVSYPTPQGKRKGVVEGLSLQGHLLIRDEKGLLHTHSAGELEWEEV